MERIEQGAGGLVLDDGRKWRVSPSMMAPIRRHQDRLRSARPEDLSEAGAATALADSLFNDMDELVRACDMKGRGHDVLHDWLMPHMGLLQRLERAADADTMAAVMAALDRSNDLFDRYFE